MSYSHPEQKWKSCREGYIIQAENGKFISEILANGDPEHPAIYMTRYAWDAKAWKTLRGVNQACKKIVSHIGNFTVWPFRYNSVSETRDLGVPIRMKEA